MLLLSSSPVIFAPQWIRPSIDSVICDVTGAPQHIIGIPGGYDATLHAAVLPAAVLSGTASLSAKKPSDGENTPFGGSGLGAEGALTCAPYAAI